MKKALKKVRNALGAGVVSLVLLASPSRIGAEPIETVAGYREGIDAAYFEGARFRFNDNGSALIRAGASVPLGEKSKINFLGVYNGESSNGKFALFGPKVGLEAELNSGKKELTLDGVIRGILGQVKVGFEEEGTSMGARIARGEKIGPYIIQAGVSGQRDPNGNYGAGLDVLGILAQKAGETTLIPYAGGNMGDDLKGYSVLGLVVIPGDSRVSLGVQAGSATPLDPESYNFNAEVRIR